MAEKTAAQQAVIMLIDDDPENLKLLSQILSEQGFQVRQALNGRLALKVIFQQLPDLIILDVRMPEIDGFEVCRQLKKDDAAGKVPIIFISGLESPGDKVQAFAMGAQDYITKPFQDTEVLARVKLHLELSTMKQHLEDMVHERTIKLAESNTALKVLLEHRDSERKNFEENVITHIDTLITPYLQLLQETVLDSRQNALLETVKANLREVTAPFSATLYSRALGLTRREMETAALIKTGKTNQEIAGLLNISERAVSFHRQNLRKKLGLLGQKVNLVAYLNEITLK